MATHVEDFASELRALKERSGRSYGVLAARLHVSTSTLHRYCNGAAVPGDYAPVERFARQCGATPEELVSLHRIWLLADAARRREPNRAAGAAVTPAAPVTPVLPVTPVAPVAPATPATPATPVAPAPAGPGEADPPEGDGPAAPAPAADVPRGETPAAPLAPLPEVVETVETVQAGGDRSARRPRRTKAALGAVAVIAAVLPFALYTGSGSDDKHAAAPHSHLTAGPTAGATTQTPSSAATSASASASASASDSAAGRTSQPASAAGRTTRSPSARPPISTAPPVQVTVLSDNWDTQCDQWFLLTRQPAKVPPPPSLQETNAWAAALDGIPAGDLRLQLTAQSLPGQPVVLHALYVKVVSSGTAPKGTGYTPGAGCGGGIEPASFAVDLDTTVPRAKAVAGYQGTDDSPSLANFPFQVSAGDSQVLDVDAHTSDRDVSWYLELVWSRGDQQGTLRIDDHGRPFRTVGLKGAPTYFYDGQIWSPAEPQS